MHYRDDVHLKLEVLHSGYGCFRLLCYPLDISSAINVRSCEIVLLSPN